MLFHECSKHIRNWMVSQPHVKEESLSDWLLFEISRHNPAIYYQAFSRHEEAGNGADWEWWILTKLKEGSNAFAAYRFRVQAKKLSKGKDNYPCLCYSNKNGLQIDLLMKNARAFNAFPLYMYYSTSKPNLDEQIKNSLLLDEKTIRWCADCSNGCFVSGAQDVYNLLFGSARKQLTDMDLLDFSYSLSLLDLLLKKTGDYEYVLSSFNQKIAEQIHISDERPKHGVYGVKHFGTGIPDYLTIFVQRRRESANWFESQMGAYLPDIGGLGVIDLRSGGNEEPD